MINTTDTVTYGLGLSIGGGPSITADNHFEAEGYEKIEAVIPKNSVATTIDVQPSEVNELKAIAIVSDLYTDLTFTVDEVATEFTLDGPLVLIGKGNIGMLGATLNALTFTNANVTVNRNVTILVARTAIEPGT